MTGICQHRFKNPCVRTFGYLLSSQTGFNSTVSLNIASAGAYIKPVSLNLSIDIRIGTIVSDGNNYRGIGLGFFTTTPANGVESSAGFTGLTVTPDGTLRLLNNGTATATTAPAPAGFSVNQFYTLSYRVNTATGTISNVIYNGTDDSSFFTAATTNLTTSNSNLAGFYGSTGDVNTRFGYVDNFVVVPEPATASLPLALLAVFGLGVRLLRARRVA